MRSIQAVELTGDGEIVHRRADDDDVGSQKLLQSGVRRHREIGGSEMGQRRGTEIAMNDLDPRVFLAEAVHDRGRNPAAHGVIAEDAGVEVQELHVTSPGIQL